MRCSFCFSDEQSGETCAVCGSPLHGLTPQKAVASELSTRLLETAVQLPASHAVLSRPTKTKQKIAPQSVQTSQEAQLIARRKFDDTILAAAFWTQNRRDDSIAFVTRGGELQLWNPSSDTLQRVSTPRARTASPCHRAAFDAMYQRVAVAFEDGAIELLETAHDQSSTRLQESGALATSLSLADEAEVLAVAAEDGTIRWWDLSSVDAKPTIIDLCELLRALAIAPNATWLACGNDSGQVQVWNLKSSLPLQQAQWRFEAHRLWVSALAFSPNAQMLASGGYDGTVRLYAAQNGFEMARFPAANESHNDKVCGNERRDDENYNGAVSALCFADNRFVAIGFARGTIVLLDVWTGTTTPLTHLSSPVAHLAASRDGFFVVALCRNEVSLFHLPDFLP